MNETVLVLVDQHRLAARLSTRTGVMHYVIKMANGSTRVTKDDPHLSAGSMLAAYAHGQQVKRPSSRRRML